MKRKNFFYGGVMALMMAFSMSACSESDDPKPDTGGTDDPTNLDYTAENADAWGNYMYNVGMLLNQDASDLYKYWTEDYDGKGPYATIFKDQTSGAYSSALACIQEMVEGGMWNIANEVGDAKIKDPWENIPVVIRKVDFMLWNHGIAGIHVMTIRIISFLSVIHTTDALMIMMWIKSTGT